MSWPPSGATNSGATKEGIMPVRPRHQRETTTPHLSPDDSHPSPLDTVVDPRAVPATPARTRTSAAWVGVCVGALVLIALVVFMLQNTTPVEVTFLGLVGTAPLALVLLIAGLGVGLVALVVGSLRIGQLRRRIRADRQPTPQLRSSDDLGA